MSTFTPQRGDLVVEAQKVYDEELKAQLEAEHFGEIIALEPVSHDYVLGKTMGEVDEACRQQFSGCPVYVFRVGGGGAVKIGGAIKRGRIS